MLDAWQEFLHGKKKRKDVAEFSVNLIDNILLLHQELASKKYKHGDYYAFKINDPKPRDIHKASVRDRLLHHAIYRILYSFFDQKFIFDSYSCRIDKGTHRAMNQFRRYCRIISQNHTRTAWVLKCDIKKFFASIDHEILKRILKRQIKDRDIFWLLENIIDSFSANDRIASSASTPSRNDNSVGLPLGNLTSQLLVNIYMNEFDQFVKRKLKTPYYIRYADDFVILHESREYLENILLKVGVFLKIRLKLSLHPDKVFIKALASGIDFLGWVHFSHHRVLRNSTKKRMFKRLSKKQSKEALASYRGLLGHGDAYKSEQKIFKFIISF
ncbi:reverse transcriptase domain-containing protein [Patescibacteria group bacterium]